MSNGLCTLCNLNDENIVHIFYKCPKICMLWNKIKDLIFKISNVHIHINEETVLFGYQSNCKHIRLIVNWILFSGNWFLWKNRNNVKYGKELCKPVDKIFCEVIQNCKFEITHFKNKAISKITLDQIKYVLDNQKN